MGPPGYRGISTTKNNCPIKAVGGTIVPISEDIAVSAQAANDILFFWEAKDIVLGSGEEIVIRLQQQSAYSDNWYNVGDPQATARLDDGDREYCIALTSDLEIEAMVLPLLSVVRLVVDTGATSTVTIDNVRAYVRT